MMPIVELTLRIALAGFYNRFNDAQIDGARPALPASTALPGSNTAKEPRP
jgi:hypothetical protein